MKPDEEIVYDFGMEMHEQPRRERRHLQARGRRPRERQESPTSSR